MNFSEAALAKAFQVLEDIEAKSGKNAKHDLLVANTKNKALQAMLRMALDRSTFGVKPAKLESYATSQRAIGDLESVWELFENLTMGLASRKVTGNAAKDALTDFFRGLKNFPIAAKWCHRILAKNLRCGIDHTVSKVWPNLVIRWGVPKGMSLVDQKTNKIVKKLDAVLEDALEDGVDSQPKCDGVHGVTVCDTGAMHSSSGDLYPAVNIYATAIAEAVDHLKLPEIFDGFIPLVSGECESEYDSMNVADAQWDSPWGKGGALAKLGRTATGFDPKRITASEKALIKNDFKFVIYDIYPDLAQREEVYIDRDVKRKLLKAIVRYCNENAKRLGIRVDSITLIPQERCYSRKELRAAHERWLKLGYEGSILRLPEALTVADSKTRKVTVNFFKWKEYAYFDAVILGIKAGKRNTKNEGRGGSFIVWEPQAKEVLCVTIPTDAAKDLASTPEAAIALTGYWIEAVKQKDAGGDVAVARFPTLSRFRDDLPPMTESDLARIARHPAVREAGIVVEANEVRGSKAKRIVMEMARACNEKPVTKATKIAKAIQEYV